MKQSVTLSSLDRHLIRQDVLQMIQPPASKQSSEEAPDGEVRSFMLLVLTEHIINSMFWTTLIDTVETEIRRGGFQFILTVINPQQETQTIGPADGYLMIGSIPLHYIDGLQGRGKPMVWIDSEIKYYNTNHVCVNNGYGVYHLVKHAIEMGHRRLAYIGSEDHLSWRQRRRGMVDCVEEFETAGVTCDYVISLDRRGAVLDLLTRKNRPTFVMASSDATANVVYIIAEQLLLRIPDDLSVAGFDNLQESKYLKPPLSTAEVPLIDMAITAVELVIKCMRNPQRPHERISLEPLLIFRESIAPPPPG